MVNYSVQELEWALGAEHVGAGEGVVRRVSIDSRGIQRGDDVLFFALKGPHHDGHDFVKEAYLQGGMRHFVVSENRPEYNKLPLACFFIVDDTLKALQHLARYHRQRFELPVVGITGSNGKTVVKEWLYEVLQPYLRVHHSPKSYNSQVGVALSLLGLTPNYTLGLYEAGISKHGEMAALAQMIQPTVGIFTHLGSAHQEGFADMQSKCLEKLELFRTAQKVVLSRDEEQAYDLAQQALVAKGVELITWSIKGLPATMPVSLGASTPEGVPFHAEYHGKSLEGFLPFGDQASISNALHVLLSSLVLGLTAEQAVKGLRGLRAMPMRLARREGSNGFPLINDSYSCDLDSLRVALQFLHQQAGEAPGAVILSDIRQSGLPAEVLYAQVAQLVAQSGADRFVGVGSDMMAHQHLFPGGHFFATTEQLLAHWDPQIVAGHATLVKGSREFGFERVCAMLEQQRHRTQMEISLSALGNNLHYFEGLLRPGVKLLVLVKAFAYGNGCEELGQFLQYHHVDYLGVAFADEGVRLRHAGVHLPILVLDPAPDAFPTLLQHQLEPEIATLSMLRGYAAAAQAQATGRVPIHIKLDTGMHRVGFQRDELNDLLTALKQLPQIEVRGIMTHLAVADERTEDAFTHQQLVLFAQMAQRIDEALGYHPLWHALNSAGIERFPEAMYDMVRLGIGLHGLSAVGAPTLQPVASLVTYVMQVKHLHPGDTVGYGRKGKVLHDMTIATIPIGYADGFLRRLGNGVGKVGIRGHLAPVFGNVCMDTCMVNVTGLGAQEGDAVTIFGTSPTLEEVAKYHGTIPYEVLSTISPRVARIYYED